jgi:hypothetical protein
VSTIDHLNTLENMFRNHTRVNHLDVKLKLFSLSLEEDALDWLVDFPTDGISKFEQMENLFLEKWGVKRDNRYLLSTLSTTKRNGNKTMV